MTAGNMLQAKELSLSTQESSSWGYIDVNSGIDETVTATAVEKRPCTGKPKKQHCSDKPSPHHCNSKPKKQQCNSKPKKQHRSDKINKQHFHHSRSSCKKECDPIILFSADTSECRIGLNDRSLIETGQADFVTAFNGNDFQCSVIKVSTSEHCHISEKASKHSHKKNALQILPLNGSSFTFGVPPIGIDGPTINGLFDHVKFLAYSINTTAPESEGELCSRWVGSGTQLNVDLHPFGSAVKDPNEDARLACFNFVALDPELLLTFDWICTNKIIYVLAERLPLLGTDYAAYTYL